MTGGSLTVAVPGAQPRGQPFRPRRTHIFAAAVLVPGALMFFAPLAFSDLPMRVHLSGWTASVAGAGVAKAVAVAAVWFVIVGGLVLWGSGASDVSYRVWAERGVWHAFVACSLGGSAVALVHGLVRLPGEIEEIVHQLAFAPIIGLVLGLSLLAATPRDAAFAPRAPLVRMMVALDAFAALVVPVLLARATPVATGLAALLYGMAVCNLTRGRIAVLIGCALLLVMMAVPVRQFLRIAVYGSRVYQRTEITEQPRRFSLNTDRAGSVPMGIIRVIDAALGQERDRANAFDPAAAGLRLPRVGGPFGLLEYELGGALDRLNRLSDLAYVVEMTPTHIPYAGGQTYSPLQGVLVPRALWRSKPTDASGSYYAQRYGFLPPDALATQTYNLPIVTEGWMNAGWVGVIGSALVFGFVLRVLSRYWTAGPPFLVKLAIGMAVVGSAADIESSLSLTVGGIVHAFFVYWALGRMAGARDRWPIRHGAAPSLVELGS